MTVRLDVGDIAAQKLGGLDGAAETLGQGRIERDFAEVVQQSADKRLGRIDRAIAQRRGDQLGCASDRNAMFPEFPAAKLR